MPITTKFSLKKIVDRFGDYYIFIGPLHVVGSFREESGELAGLYLADSDGTHSSLTATPDQQFAVTIVNALP
jgi:hypothetical protein